MSSLNALTLPTVCYNRGHNNNNEQPVIINNNTAQHSLQLATLQLVLLYCGHYILSVQ